MSSIADDMRARIAKGKKSDDDKNKKTTKAVAKPSDDEEEDDENIGDEEEDEIDEEEVDESEEEEEEPEPPKKKTMMTKTIETKPVAKNDAENYKLNVIDRIGEIDVDSFGTIKINKHLVLVPYTLGGKVVTSLVLTKKAKLQLIEILEKEADIE